MKIAICSALIVFVVGACGTDKSGAPGTGGAGGDHGAGGATAVDGGVDAAGGAAPGTGGTAGAAVDAAAADRTGAGADAPRADAAADTGAHADAAGDGAVGYAPCPADGSPCIIMPLGDSITDGFPFENGGYRVELFHQAVQGANPITFVGRNVNGPTTVDGMPFPRGHEGYSGFTIDTDATHSGISPLVGAAITMFHPHIILLHIGTNDINGNVDRANAPTRLGALIDRITNATSALVVVAQIIPTTNDGTNGLVRTYNAAIPALVQQRAAAGRHVMLIDMYTLFTARADYKTALMNDVLHPNVTGYATMGDAWYASLRALLPTR